MTDSTVSTARGQIGMAFRLANANATTLRHVKGIGWYVWTGARWAEDTDNKPMRRVIQCVEDARMAAAKESSSDARRALWQDAQACSSEAALNGVLNIARALKPIAIPVSALDQDPYLFNCHDGTLDLRTLEMYQHNQDDLITRIAGCGYDSQATGVVFHKFLAEVLPDPAVRDYVQRLFGYSMLGIVKEHILPLFIGRGRNGKGALLDAVLAAFGDYGIVAAPTLLLERSGNASTTDKVDLLGRRLVVCSETDEGNRFAAATVKDLTGGGTITARRLYKDNITFRPSHTMFMMTNYPPKTNGSDFAMFERLRKVTFGQEFIGKRQDPHMPEKLQMELPAILRWVVEGYVKYVEFGLTPPSRVVDDTRRYQLENDTKGRFIDECCVLMEHARVKVSILHKAWEEWSSTHAAESVMSFSMAMERRGFEKKVRKDGSYLLGIGLKTSDGE